MVTVIVIRQDDPEAVVRLRGAIRDKRNALQRIGHIMEAASQKAFIEQKFGDFLWPERYPDQEEPFINIAGAISDFALGASKPKQRRFDRRPALSDRGILKGSIRSSIVSADTVDCGTTVPYAAAHHFGLETTQPVTDDTKKRISKWLLRDGREYRGKLTPVLQKGRSSWTTRHMRRPILGVTPQMEPDIGLAVEESIAEGTRGGNA